MNRMRAGWAKAPILEHFFPTIDHAILRAQLARVIADRSTLWLVDQILDNGVGSHTGEVEPRFFPGDDLFAALRPRGLPIGKQTSQFWADAYLNPLDQFVKRDLKCAASVCYGDDFLLFAHDKPTLHQWKTAVIEFAANLRLTPHEREAVVVPVATLERATPFTHHFSLVTHYSLSAAY